MKRETEGRYTCASKDDGITPLRVWGWREGRGVVVGGRIETTSSVGTFVDIPAGSEVDILWDGFCVRVEYVMSTRYSTTFAISRTGEEITLQNSEFTLHAYENAWRVILPLTHRSAFIDRKDREGRKE